MANQPAGLNHSKVVNAGSGERFNGFFGAGKKWSFNKGSLLDARARRVFEMTGRACEAGVYPYQLPLESRSGPWVRADGRKMLMLSSCDYLGLIGDSRIDQAAIEAVRKYGTGTAGARLLTGTLDLHNQVERELAEFKGTEEAITLSSGYIANLAVISALLSAQDRVILDSLSHRSLVDACRLAGVPLQRFNHNDLASLRHELESGPPANRTLIIADGVFSMDGDICRLPELVEIKKEFGVYLMIDDAHAFGVLGAHGRGTDEHFGVKTSDVDVWTGTLAKAIPSAGGFVAVSQEIAIYLQHAAAPTVYSTALCPSAAAAVSAALEILKSEPQRVARLTQNASFLRNGLRELGYDVGLSETPIVPVILHHEDVTTIFAGRLREMGIAVTPVMFPAVAQGTARLRLCATAAHTTEDLEFALQAFRQLRQ